MDEWPQSVDRSGFRVPGSGVLSFLRRHGTSTSGRKGSHTCHGVILDQALTIPGNLVLKKSGMRNFVTCTGLGGCQLDASELLKVSKRPAFSSAISRSRKSRRGYVERSFTYV